MIRDTAQRCAICQRLLQLGGLDAEMLWTDEGPTEEASALVFAPVNLDGSQIVLLRLAWDVWSGSGGCRVVDLLHHLGKNMRAVGELVTALADDAGALDAWLKEWRLPRRSDG